MAVTRTSRLLTPEEIAVQAGQQVPFLRLPDRASVFAERETRLRQLAAGHAMRDYLLFAAELARAQHERLQRHPEVALPSAAQLDVASRAGLPPLSPAAWPRDPQWRTELRALLGVVHGRLAAGSPARAVVQRLRDAGDLHLEQQADRLLGEQMFGLDLATAPLVAAGLQLHWTQLVIATEAARGDGRSAPFGRTDDATLCPCCGSLPTASVTRIGAEAEGYRYLHCSLCSAQWHMVRIKCAHCLGTAGIGYESLRPLHDQPATATTGAARDAVQVETCQSCGHYLKIVHMERDLHVEPVADDLASLTLDLLVSDAGMRRHGVNLLLLFGEDDDAREPAAAATAAASAVATAAAAASAAAPPPDPGAGP